MYLAFSVANNEMNFKIVCLLLLILRAGLAESANTYDNENSTFTYNDVNPTTSPIIPDKCVNFGTISNCTSESPYCFVYGDGIDDIGCGPIENRGWRISPLDGLVLNNEQESNSYCELFIPPEQPKTIETLKKLLKDSEFGSEFKDRESAWFNIFEYLGNCPWKSQFCDKESKTCQILFEVGKNCSSSNQCLTRYCEKYDRDAPESERRCVEKNDTEEEKSGLSKEKIKWLLIVIIISIGSSILIFEMTICSVRAQRRKRFLLKRNNFVGPLLPSSSNYLHNNHKDEPFNRSSTATRHLTFLHSSLMSRISFRHFSKSTSDRLSVLLPPPPTLSRNSSLRVNSHHNSNNNNYNNHYLDDVSIKSNRDSIDSFDSFDIYLPPKQFQHENSFDLTY